MGQTWDSTPRTAGKHRAPVTAQQRATRRTLIRLAIACAALCTVMGLAAAAPAALTAAGFAAALIGLPVLITCGISRGIDLLAAHR